MKPLAFFVIPSRCYIKKNTQRIVGFGKSKRAIYSPKFRAWHKIAMLHLKLNWRGREPLDEPLELTVRFYFKNHAGEADLSNLVESPQDALKDAGVIVDDRLIQVLHAQKFYGETPRTEIELRSVGEASA